MEEFTSAINWFEIPANDFDRAMRFYSEIYEIDMPTRDMGHLKMGFFQHEPGKGTGGTIVTEKKQISPEIGCIAIIIDTEGNRIYLHSMK